MKLTQLQITNYRSVADSNDFQIADVTCLVGKNESGKTNILRCLERLNSLDSKVKAAYDEDMDWPRASDDVPDSEARVVAATWHIEDHEAAAIEESLGADALKSRNLKTETKFSGKSTWEITLNEEAVKTFLWTKFTVPPDDQAKVADTKLDALVATIDQTHADSTFLKSVADYVRTFRDSRPILKAIDHLKLPEMLYFASYDRLGGRISLEDLIRRRNEGAASLTREHQLFLMFLEYAGVKPEELQNPKTAEAHIARLERAQNRITNKIFKYWTQNRELAVKFEAIPGRPQDQAPFNGGTVFHTRIYNTKSRKHFSSAQTHFWWRVLLTFSTCRRHPALFAR